MPPRMSFEKQEVHDKITSYFQGQSQKRILKGDPRIERLISLHKEYGFSAPQLIYLHETAEKLSPLWPHQLIDIVLKHMQDQPLEPHEEKVLMALRSNSDLNQEIRMRLLPKVPKRPRASAPI